MGAIEAWRPQPLERLQPETVRGIANTDLVPKPLRGNVPAIIATILKGRALGLDDMHALSAIHFIDGRPTLSAETMVMLARRAGHSITGDWGDGAVTVRGRRGDNGDEMSVTWTMQMAARAGLTSRANWKAYPESMLWARAVSQLCRMLFPDVLAGTGYTPDELEMSPEEQAVADVGPVRVPDGGEPDDNTVDADPVLEGSAGDPGGDREGAADAAQVDAMPEGTVAAASSPAEQESFFKAPPRRRRRPHEEEME